MKKPKFPLGQLLMTRGIANTLPHERLLECLRRHVSGDWGLVDGEDRQANDDALVHGARLLSVYLVDEADAAAGWFWVITERDRSVTTALLPSEY
ncbi:MAG TPA: hypothetical protein PKJ45_08410 [Rubrivivax sp.]|nr:hypothetical protein [Rubrivivax sp.]